MIQEHGEDGPDGSTIESGASCVAPRIRCLGGQLSGAATQAQTELTKPTLGANARRARAPGAPSPAGASELRSEVNHYEK